MHGRVGRPPAEVSEALGDQILDIATRRFVEKGYTATSVEQIAADAGVGKQTIYKRHPSKVQLFQAVVENMTSVLADVDEVVAAAPHDPMAALREVCRRMLVVATLPEARGIFRVLVGESARFPELIENTVGHISNPLYGTMRQLLVAARDAGTVGADCDVENAVRAALGLSVGWWLSLGQLDRAELRDEEREAYFDFAWGVFVAGLTRRPDAASPDTRDTPNAGGPTRSG